jgi:glycosyltransferase involved in cell wall biosynthesis
MKVAFLTPSISRAAGGIFEIQRSLARSLSNLPQTEVEVFSVRDERTCLDLPSWDAISVRIEEAVGPRAFGYSRGLRRAFLNCDADLTHLHALWMYTSMLTLQWARRLGKPHLITLNGMLDSWALNNSRMKKKFALALYENRNLRLAACIQVNTEAELRSARAFGLTNPICVIPNGVDLPDIDKINYTSGIVSLSVLKRNGHAVMLYLGRLHPKKNLSALLESFAKSCRFNDNWILAIAGWGQGNYEQSLRRQARELEIEDRVRFIGPQYGEQKARCFSEADGFVLPSHSEGLPMAVLEAWSYAKPILMTPQCNLEIGFRAGAAVNISTDVHGIAQGLCRFFEMSEEERLMMGRRGRALVENTFTWPSVAGQMRAVYDWVLNGGQRPSYVFV